MCIISKTVWFTKSNYSTNLSLIYSINIRDNLVLSTSVFIYYTTLSMPGYSLGSDTLIVGNNLLPFSVEQLPTPH